MKVSYIFIEAEFAYFEARFAIFEYDPEKYEILFFPTTIISILPDIN